MTQLLTLLGHVRERIRYKRKSIRSEGFYVQ